MIKHLRLISILSCWNQCDWDYESKVFLMFSLFLKKKPTAPYLYSEEKGMVCAKYRAATLDLQCHFLAVMVTR